ncbi:gliding motility-associated C-terminal domain-containing protein [Reichenbachiella faecimaris]|nr:gliding motility-associated C-terminal domain-containing protein [Reichenbachiella faecimaris]
MKRFSYFLILGIVSTSQVKAQNLMTNDHALVAIGNDVPFTVQGNLSNQGMMLNEGDLRLLGDWTNVGNYSSVSGTFYLLGSDPLFESGSSTYQHLGISTMGNLSLASDLTISGTLELISGVMNFLGDASLTIEEDAVILGGDESSYVNGLLYSAQQGEVHYPIGTDQSYLPVELLNVQSSVPVGIVAMGEELDVTLSQALESISPNRYWQIMKNADFSVDGLVLPVTNEHFISSESEAVIAYTENLGSPLTILGQSEFTGSTTSGSITSNTPILSGYYLLGDKGLALPPVKVINIVTPLQDGKHDFLRIENIEFYEENVVEIFNRQGKMVFSMLGYNNLDRVFRGDANVGNGELLPTGNYFYTVNLDGSKRESGFVYIKN